MSVKVKSVWTSGPVWIRDPYSKTLDQLIPSELYEEFFCQCGRRGMYTKAQVLNHLIQDHGVSNTEAKEIWLNIDEDLSAINSKTLFVRKNEPTPKEYEGCKIYSWAEWEALMKRELEKEREGSKDE